MADFDFLPEDVINKILLRLPAKSIGRFRCVSKLWRSSLLNPQFIKAHFDFHICDPENTLLLTASAYPDYPFIITLPTDRRSSSKNDGVSKEVTCSLIQPHEFVRVEGTCRGLVLLVHKSADWTLVHQINDWTLGRQSTDWDRMVLWNPLTLEAVEVPECSLPRHGFANIYYGLGYEDYDFKIVRISCPYRHKNPGSIIDVYNVKLKTWRRVANPRYDYNIFGDNSGGVFVNGCLHWLAEPQGQCGGGSPLIAAFNLAREEFDEVPLPGLEYITYRVTVLGGCLAFQGCSCWQRFPIELWVMEEYGVQESWTKLTINGREDIQFAHEFRPVCVLREEEEEEIVLARWLYQIGKIKAHNDRKLFAYNLRNGVWRDIVVAGVPPTSSGATDYFVPFKETLWSPK